MGAGVGGPGTEEDMVGEPGTPEPESGVLLARAVLGAQLRQMPPGDGEETGRGPCASSAADL